MYIHKCQYYIFCELTQHCFLLAYTLYPILVVCISADADNDPS